MSMGEAIINHQMNTPKDARSEHLAFRSSRIQNISVSIIYLLCSTDQSLAAQFAVGH